MSKPIKHYEDPIHGAAQELTSAMSALNMPAEPLLKPNGIYLSETDVWAQHAMEHLRAVHEQLVLADKERQLLRSKLHKCTMKLMRKL